VIIVVAALKGGVGKTTTAVYLAAVAASGRRATTVVDADPQASAAEWIEAAADDGHLDQVGVVEAPTERLVAKALGAIGADEIAIVDTPPGHERLLTKALERADVVVIPTRVGGVETPRVEAVLELVDKVPAGLVICSARTYTRDFQEALVTWGDAGVPVWASVPERVTIAAGPRDRLAFDGLEAYRALWRRALRVARGG
jgi:chromosome partitioning protein